MVSLDNTYFHHLLTLTAVEVTTILLHSCTQSEAMAVGICNTCRSLSIVCM